MCDPWNIAEVGRKGESGEGVPSPGNGVRGCNPGKLFDNWYAVHEF